MVRLVMRIIDPFRFSMPNNFHSSLNCPALNSRQLKVLFNMFKSFKMPENGCIGLIFFKAMFF